MYNSELESLRTVENSCLFTSQINWNNLDSNNEILFRKLTTLKVNGINFDFLNGGTC